MKSQLQSVMLLSLLGLSLEVACSPNDGNRSDGATTASGSATGAALGGSGGTVLGGSSSVAAGGSSSVAAGGSSSVAAGGSSSVAVGGSSSVAAGGSSSAVLGGSSSVAAGGSDSTAVGGSGDQVVDGSGGADATGPQTISGGTGGLPPATSGSGGTATGGDQGVGPQDPPAGVDDISFSTPSGTFEGSLAVTMTTSATGKEIRYTTDGTLPTASSTLYDGSALAISETTQLRAQLFDAGGASGQPKTAIYIARAFDVTSDIPIIIMDGYGAGKPPTEPGPEKVIFRDLGIMLFEPTAGEASISAAPTWAARAGYHVRGQSSANFEKTPYRVELWDEYDDDADYPMIGMTPDSDWAFVGPYLDKSLVRNAFIYSLADAMGMEGPALQFAEVYINQDGGPLEPSDYEGVYGITETIKNSKGRLNLKQLEPDDTDEAKLSGGYIVKFDMGALREDEGEIEIPCISAEGEGEEEEEEAPGFGTGFGGGSSCFSDLELVDPKDPNEEQLAWIQAYMQGTHDALHAEPIGDYQQWLDLPSFVEEIVLNEFTMGGDIYVRSRFMYKERGGLLKAGPVWDYNLTMGNLTADIESWQIESGVGGNDWFSILFELPEVRSAAAARWAELRQGFLSDEQIQARIDAVAAPLLNAGPRDLERWPVGESSFGFPGLGGGNPVGTGGAGGTEEEVEEDPRAAWEGQLADLKQWTLDRCAWLDAQYEQL